ncbi:hypothetical protein CORC01_05608 [Colletotrichum orchidophilum]|uniref:Lysine-specific metallo-endopeptidase domain-containing protein n=1 Tax=Colletotrichum orchidophilum TaxID=1209926 RepID=A0A1G4BCQ2_9PEZI|nr:uncharacterized protein CORC01_05608 [Colletotrichum orchidophilum]OHE99115.1 hypothetical protein CORC01_05608 [Colletotrichum orchidophilum]
MRVTLALQWLITLAHCHTIGDSFISDFVTLEKRTLRSVAIAGRGGLWPCGVDQLKNLQVIIKSANELAQNAAGVLDVDGSENSAAYLKWFGKANANARTRNALKTSNYESLVMDLRFPGGTFSFNPRKLDPKGLSFACWLASEQQCKRGLIAIVMAAGYHPGFKTNFNGPVLAMCPRFFTLPSQDQVIKALEQESPELQLSADLTLVHEMQHVSLTTGNERFCDDQIELSKTYGKGNGCYDIKCCTSIPDEAKIKNAQNFALFALDIAAFPQRGKWDNEGNSCVIGGLGKRMPIDQVRPLRGSGSVSGHGNHTIRSGSWMKSNLRSSPTPQVSPLPRSSSQPPPSSRQTSSSRPTSSTLQPIPRPSPTQSLAPTATPEVLHVSNGETVAAVVGAIIIAGAGGGLVLVPSGALLPIAAGTTAVVTASTAANGAQEYELEEKKKQDDNIPTPSVTPSVPASGTPSYSVSLCSHATSSNPGPEPATPDAPGFTFMDVLLLPGPEPTAFVSMSEHSTTTNSTTSILPTSTTTSPVVPVLYPNPSPTSQSPGKISPPPPPPPPPPPKVLYSLDTPIDPGTISCSPTDSFSAVGGVTYGFSFDVDANLIVSIETGVTDEGYEEGYHQSKGSWTGTFYAESSSSLRICGSNSGSGPLPLVFTITEKPLQPVKAPAGKEVFKMNEMVTAGTTSCFPTTGMDIQEGNYGFSYTTTDGVIVQIGDDSSGPKYFTGNGATGAGLMYIDFSGGSISICATSNGGVDAPLVLTITQ